METSLPFRHEDEISLFSKIHPVVRLILPFILVIPFLLIKDIFLIISIIIITFFFSLITRLKISRIIKRIKSIISFIILITIFTPLYVGKTIIFQYKIGININVYKEGINLALLMFFRIFGAIYVFMSFFSSLTYSEFIEALTKLRIIPSLFIGSLIIMLHYIPILSDSNQKILEAQELRGKKITTYGQKLKTHAFIMGKSIVMNMERSERLYESLKMRGFTGKITFATRKIKLTDFITLTIFCLMMIILVFLINLELFYQGVIGLFLS